MFSASLERLDAVPEYQVVPDGDMFRTSFLDSFLFTSEYQEAQALKARLLDEHQGTTSEDLFSGDEVETPCGPAFRIDLESEGKKLIFPGMAGKSYHPGRREDQVILIRGRRSVTVIGTLRLSEA